MKMEWIRCTEALPTEGETEIGGFTMSRPCYITIEAEIKGRIVDRGHLSGGKWKSEKITRLEGQGLDYEVIAWSPITRPEPWQGDAGKQPTFITPNKLYDQAMARLEDVLDDAKQSALWLVRDLWIAMKDLERMDRALATGMAWLTNENEDKDDE